MHKSFEGTPVLQGVSLALPKGETHVVMGGSGSGKTVMLRLTAGLIRPDAGQIRLFGTSIERLSEEQLLPLRRRLGYVFQGAALFDSLSVYENVAYPLREHRRLSEAEIRARVVDVLAHGGPGRGGPRPLARRAVGRDAQAGGDRPGHRRRARGAALRRADRRASTRPTPSSWSS